VDTYTNGGPVAAIPLPKTILGAGLANRRFDKRQLACLVVAVHRGEVPFSPSMKQLAHTCGVSLTYVAAAGRLSPAKRTAILQGRDSSSFAALVNPPRQLSLAGPVIPDLKAIPDTVLENMIRAAGTERVLEIACAVEQHT
jgi:hypothetical protein